MLPESELLKFRFPKVREVEAVLVQLEDGTVVVRTVEELEKALEEDEVAM